MIETYKLLHGYEEIPCTRFFQLNTNNLRGHSLKLAKPDHWRTTLKGNWFSIRVIDKWNTLPERVVTARTVATFKNRYDRHIGIALNVCLFSWVGYLKSNPALQPLQVYCTLSLMTIVTMVKFSFASGMIIAL